MAKRDAVLLDIKTVEDFNELLKVNCLLVLNVYSGFFGPCTAIAANLRDFKMIVAGDDLQLATVNADNIDALKRFRNKSEPAYLFLYNGRVINFHYGCNNTILIQLIQKELEICKTDEVTKRKSYELRGMTAIEAYRFKLKREAMIENRKKDQAKKQIAYYDFKMQTTDDIMENAADIGVTIFMPHVIDEDLVAKLIEPGTKMDLQQKSSFTTKISKQDLEMINFDGQNLSPILFNHIRDKELLIVAWKVASGELRPINEVFSEFVRSLQTELVLEKPKSKKKDVKGKLGKAKTGKTKNKPVEENVTEENIEVVEFKLDPLGVSLSDLQKEKLEPIQIEPIDLQFIEDETDLIKLISGSFTDFTESRIVDLHNECIKTALINVIGRTKEETDQENEKPAPVKKGKAASKKGTTVLKTGIIYDPKDKNLAYISPVWTPPTPRCNASFLYLYFRRLLSFFLPMERPGASRFVIVVFSVNKHEEILEEMKEHKSDVLAHGMFRGFVDGEDFRHTKLISKTGVEYRHGSDQQPDDKLILKVCSNSETLLTLVDRSPEYVSQNEHDAYVECDVIFPLGYVSISEEEAQSEMNMDEMFGNGEEENDSIIEK